MRPSRLTSRLQRMTTLLLCVTISMAGLATAASALRAGDFAGRVAIDGGRKLYLECRGTGRRARRASWCVREVGRSGTPQAAIPQRAAAPGGGVSNE